MGTTVGSEEEDISYLNIYPNPANNYISWSGNENVSSISVYNVMGQMVLNSSSYTSELNTESLKDGLYFVDFYEGSTLLKRSKVVIQH